MSAFVFPWNFSVLFLSFTEVHQKPAYQPNITEQP